MRDARCHMNMLRYALVMPRCCRSRYRTAACVTSYSAESCGRRGTPPLHFSQAPRQGGEATRRASNNPAARLCHYLEYNARGNPCTHQRTYFTAHACSAHRAALFYAHLPLLPRKACHLFSDALTTPAACAPPVRSYLPAHTSSAPHLDTGGRKMRGYVTPPSRVPPRTRGRAQPVLTASLRSVFLGRRLCVPLTRFLRTCGRTRCAAPLRYSHSDNIPLLYRTSFLPRSAHCRTASFAFTRTSNLVRGI